MKELKFNIGARVVFKNGMTNYNKPAIPSNYDHPLDKKWGSSSGSVVLHENYTAIVKGFKNNRIYVEYKDEGGNYLCLGFIEKDLELLVPEINNNYSIY